MTEIRMHIVFIHIDSQALYRTKSCYLNDFSLHWCELMLLLPKATKCMLNLFLADTVKYIKNKE